MSMTTPVLWFLLVLLCNNKVVWGFSTTTNATVTTIAIAASLVSGFPDTYTDNTLYYSTPVNSRNVTVPLRTQRDIAVNVTIDHWLWPTMNMSTSFFGTDYSSQKIAQVSEVMAMGYQRLVFDLYWDSTRRQWQLCPVPTDGNTASLYTCTSSSSPSSFRELLSAVDERLLATNLTTAPAKTNLYILILCLHPLSNISNSTLHDTSTVTDTLEDMLLDVIGQHRLYTPQELVHYRQNGSVYPWPTWIELINNGVQLLVGLGTNNVPASEYNISNDLDTIFEVGELLSLTTNLTNVLTSPCAYTNASWATLNDDQNDQYNYSTSLEAVECGYSPYFTAGNYSNGNATYMSEDPHGWADNIMGTVWSWDVGEPPNSINPNCAMVQRSNGRWRSSGCTELIRVACRHQDDPNEWILTSAFVSYDRAFDSCPDNYVFDCPRVAIQNQRLYQALQDNLVENDKNDPTKDDELHNLFWINLNTGSEGFCWVVGLYSTCWWFHGEVTAFANLIRTSAVAGVIILILVGIFSWVKCARSWRDRKARSRKNMIKERLTKREYVTVPA